MGNMKANRKFVEGEQAVSAVIGVILMVAITVAIAATVYVYVSGMLGGSPTAQEDAVVTQSVSEGKIRLLLTKGGQQYTDTGYIYDIYVVNNSDADDDFDDTAVAGWLVGQSIIIGRTAAGAITTGAAATDPLDTGTYGVTVVVLGTVVFDSNIKIN